MNTTICVFGLSILIVLGVIHRTVKRFVRVKPRIEDLALFLRHVDLALVESLLDPFQDAILKKTLSPRAYRKAQFKRMLAALEQLRRISHNSSFLRACASAEFERSACHKNSLELENNECLALEIVVAASKVKKCASRSVAKILTWGVLRIDASFLLPSPSVSDLRHALDHDILVAYRNLVDLIEKFALAHGHKDRIMAAL